MLRELRAGDILGVVGVAMDSLCVALMTRTGHMTCVCIDWINSEESNEILIVAIRLCLEEMCSIDMLNDFAVEITWYCCVKCPQRLCVD